MMTRLISSDATKAEFDAVLTAAEHADEQVVLEIDGEPVGLVVPMTERARNEVARQLFAQFWDEHKRWMAENPTDLTEDEIMDLVNSEIAAHRAEKAAEAAGKTLASS